MDVLWSPWRYDYINSSENKTSAASSGCVFCDILNSPADDEEKFILHRAGHNFVILNIYPYVSGHLMIVPFEHLADIDKVDSGKWKVESGKWIEKNCQLSIINYQLITLLSARIEREFGRGGGFRFCSARKGLNFFRRRRLTKKRRYNRHF